MGAPVTFVLQYLFIVAHVIIAEEYANTYIHTYMESGTVNPGASLASVEVLLDILKTDDIQT